MLPAMVLSYSQTNEQLSIVNCNYISCALAIPSHKALDNESEKEKYIEEGCLPADKKLMRTKKRTAVHPLCVEHNLDAKK